jgi:hypothetical protein
VAVVGEAHILVRAITTGVENDIKRAFKGLSGQGGSARRSGDSLGQAFSRGFNSRVNGNIFSKITDGLNSMSPAALGARKQFQSLVRTGYTLGTAVSVIIGGIASLASGFISLAGAAGAASVSALGLVGTFANLRIGAFAASLALGGVSAAVGRATSAQGGLGKTLKEINKQFKELRRSAESAAMSEKRAGLELEKARNNLARMQDLPPNNMARREAEMALEEAELNFRQAKERSKDLNDELKKGKKGIADSVNGGGADPYAGLTKSQREFAKALVNLKPKLDELKEAVAKGFLPALEDQLNRLANGTVFDVVKDGLEGIGVSLGKAATTFGDYIDNTRTTSLLEQVFDNAGVTIEDFGKIGGEALEGLLGLLVKANPLVEQFVAFLDRNLTKFNEFINAPANAKGIEEFFETVSVLASDFAEIFGNIFGGIGNIIKANTGPGSGGQIMIDYLKDITGSFKNLQEIDGKPLKDFFAGAATNATSVLGSVGALLKEIFALADNPSIKETFDTLKLGAPALGDILEASLEAGPSFANLVVTLTEIGAKLSDTGAMTIFFDTLNSIAGVINNVLGNETVKKIVDLTGRIFAFLSAVGLAFGTFKFFGNVVNGAIQSVLGPIGAMGTGILKARDSFAMLTYSNNIFARAFGRMGFTLMKTPILILIGVLVAAFIYLYNTSDSFREFIDTTLKSTLEGLGEAFGRIMEAVQPLMDLFVNELLPTLMTSLQPILEVLIAAVGSLAIFLGNVLASAIETVVPIIMSLMQFLKPVIEIFMALIRLVGEFAKALITGDWDAFGKIFMVILRDIAQGVVDLFTGLGNIIVDVLNWAINGFFNGIGGGIADIVKGLSGGAIDLKKPGFVPKIPKWTIPAFADGGVVSPQAGGTLAMVAEAGRPERIEPLDENGLSLRDKALIGALSGNGGGATINVYASPGMDEAEIANIVSRKLAFQVQKGKF